MSKEQEKDAEIKVLKEQLGSASSGSSADQSHEVSRGDWLVSREVCETYATYNYRDGSQSRDYTTYSVNVPPLGSGESVTCHTYGWPDIIFEN